MKKTTFFLLLVLFCTNVILAAGNTESADNKAENKKRITILDYYGKEETIELPIKRAVVFDTGGMLSAIKAIKAENRVVGVLKPMTRLKTHYPYLSKLPVVGFPQSPNFEAIVALKPDVVLAYTVMSKELEEKLEPETQVIRLNLDAAHTYERELRKLGLIFGEEENTQRFIDWYQGYVNIIDEKIASLSEEIKLRVFEFYGGKSGMSEEPPYGTMGKDNKVAPIIELAGGENIAAKLPGDWIVVAPEWVITENPDAIIREVYPQISGIDTMGDDATNTKKVSAMREKIINDSVFESTNAVKNDRVFLFCGHIVEKEWFIGIHYLAKALYPDLFIDLNPQTVHQEFITRFLRLDYNLSKRGVFAFPIQL